MQQLSFTQIDAINIFFVKKKLTTKMEECPICWHVKPLISLNTCGHGVCEKCLHLQLKKDARCALCRSVIVGCNPSLVCSKFERVDILFNKTLGISMKSCENGVEITRVLRFSVSYQKRLKQGDIIHSLNGLPCYNHERFLQILNACKGKIIQLDVERKAIKKITKIFCFL